MHGTAGTEAVQPGQPLQERADGDGLAVQVLIAPSFEAHVEDLLHQSAQMGELIEAQLQILRAFGGIFPLAIVQERIDGGIHRCDGRLQLVRHVIRKVILHLLERALLHHGANQETKRQRQQDHEEEGRKQDPSHLANDDARKGREKDTVGIVSLRIERISSHMPEGRALHVARRGGLQDVSGLLVHDFSTKHTERHAADAEFGVYQAIQGLKIDGIRSVQLLMDRRAHLASQLLKLDVRRFRRNDRHHRRPPLSDRSITHRHDGVVVFFLFDQDRTVLHARIGAAFLQTQL